MEAQLHNVVGNREEYRRALVESAYPVRLPSEPPRRDKSRTDESGSIAEVILPNTTPRIPPGIIRFRAAGTSIEWLPAARLAK